MPYSSTPLENYFDRDNVDRLKEVIDVLDELLADQRISLDRNSLRACAKRLNRAFTAYSIEVIDVDIELADDVIYVTESGKRRTRSEYTAEFAERTKLLAQEYQKKFGAACDAERDLLRQEYLSIRTALEVEGDAFGVNRYSRYDPRDKTFPLPPPVFGQVAIARRWDRREHVARERLITDVLQIARDLERTEGFNLSNQARCLYFLHHLWVEVYRPRVLRLRPNFQSMRDPLDHTDSLATDEDWVKAIERFLKMRAARAGALADEMDRIGGWYYPLTHDGMRVACLAFHRTPNGEYCVDGNDYRFTDPIIADDLAKLLPAGTVLKPTAMEAILRSLVSSHPSFGFLPAVPPSKQPTFA